MKKRSNCLSLVVMSDSDIYNEVSDFGINNDVDYLIGSLVSCYLQLYKSEHYKNPITARPGVRFHNVPIKSVRTAGDCCFYIK